VTLTDQIVHASRAIVVHAEPVLDGGAYQVPAARLHELEDLLARRDDPNHDLRSDRPHWSPEQIQALARDVEAGWTPEQLLALARDVAQHPAVESVTITPTPAGHRWLEASLGCPDCLEGVEILTTAAQGDEEGDEQVYVHAGDLWLCGGGHLGSIIVAAGLGGAYLADPAMVGQDRASAEVLAQGAAPFLVRAPLRRGAS
jgi:hypothetical protein